MKRLFAIAFSALLIASCGGGVGGNLDSAAQPPASASNGAGPSASGATDDGTGGARQPAAPASTATIAGVLALGGGMGPASHGTTVNAYAIEHGQKGRILGSSALASSTSLNDAYSINIQNYSGPVLLEATGGEYQDIATGRFVPLRIPLRATLPNVNGSAAATISPLTDALVELMLARGGNALSPAVIDSVHKAGQELFAFDPLATVPYRATTAPMPIGPGAYGVHLGLISQMQKDNPNATLSDAIAIYAAWLNTASDAAPAAIVKSAGSFGFNLRNRSYINNFNALATLARWLKSPAVSDTPSSTDDNSEPGVSGYTLKIINSDPEVRQFTIDELRKTFYSTYPAMAARFNADAPREIFLLIASFWSNPDAVAIAGGGTIEIDSSWLRNNPLDIDVITHEAFHIIQSYPNDVDYPKWVAEGLADYARSQYGLWNAISGWTFFHAPVQGENYTDGYSVTARFFRWMEAHYGKQFLEHLNAAMRAGIYTDDFWIRETGRPLIDSWIDYSMDPSNR